MASPSIIETGVDKLVGLVKKQKRVSIAEAAKFLNVSTDVIEEWADFLEEEGIISVEYKLTTPYLVERDMDLAEVEKKAKDFVDKKEGFIRNAEVAVAKIELDSEAVKHMKIQPMPRATDAASSESVTASPSGSNALTEN